MCKTLSCLNAGNNTISLHLSKITLVVVQKMDYREVEMDYRRQKG